MPGMPAVGTDNYPIFWMSFWAALYSGLLYSVVTGVIVGIAVWRIQVAADRRKTLREGERELALLKAKLRAALEQPKTTNINNPMSTMPHEAKALNELLATFPLDMWEVNLPKQRSFFRLLRAFNRTCADFLAVARKLDYTLRRAIRLLNASRHLMEFNDESRMMFFVGRLVGFEAADVMPWIETLTAVTISEHEEDRAVICADQRVAEHIGPFLAARDALIGSVDAIRQVIDKAQA